MTKRRRRLARTLCTMLSVVMKLFLNDQTRNTITSKLQTDLAVNIEMFPRCLPNVVLCLWACILLPDCLARDPLHSTRTRRNSADTTTAPLNLVLGRLVTSLDCVSVLTYWQSNQRHGFLSIGLHALFGVEFLYDLLCVLKLEIAYV